MALLTILTYPDPRLRKKATDVTKVTPNEESFCKDLLETMYASKGIGLAATQVGDLRRIIAVDTAQKFESEDGVIEPELTDLEKKVSQPLVLINPEIISSEGLTDYQEGCLSVPGYYEAVKRKKTVTIKYLTPKGEQKEITTDGLLAICLQHEMDHLEGKLFIDRLSLIKANRLKNKIKKYGYPEPEESDGDSDENTNKDSSDQSPK